MKSPQIRALPDDLITRIAAGEVVERPASIIKELTENSLDAGANEIHVEIAGAGRTLLRISDDGCGMTLDQAKLALTRHATSKISKLEDLESLETFGFRGEALPSIASVSRLRLHTRSADEDTGWEIQIEGGKLISEKPLAREVGTTIEVRDLFFNTPARFKFLKADSTERSQCIRVVEETAFSSTDVTFQIQVEKAKPILLQGERRRGQDTSRTLEHRVKKLWGSRVSDGLCHVSHKSPHFRVRGFVTHPQQPQATSRSQVLFINRRPVQNRRLARSVYEAYVGQLPTMRHPAWVLFLTVDPKCVDVNVHPTKREVKLTHEGEIFGFLLTAVREALSHAAWPETLTPASPESSSTPFSWPSSSPSESSPTQPTPAVTTKVMRDVYRPIEANASLFAAAKTSLPAGIKGKKLTAIAQVRRMFILAQSDEGVWILDQHAAAERVKYDQLLFNLQNEKPATQMLLVPFSWEVSHSLYAEVNGHLKDLNSLGFIMEPFGESTFVVKGYPQILGEKFDLSSLLDGVSDLFGDGDRRKAAQEQNFQHRLAAMTACKASVRAEASLDLKECQAVLDQLAETDSPLTCPHGRPTFIHYDYTDLEVRFRRR